MSEVDAVLDRMVDWMLKGADESFALSRIDARLILAEIEFLRAMAGKASRGYTFAEMVRAQGGREAMLKRIEEAEQKHGGE